MIKTTICCKICGYEIKIACENPANTIKMMCNYCGKKTIFNPKIEQKKQEPPHTGYVLAADLNINNNHVHVEGLVGRGNVSVNKTTGVRLQNMSISKKEEKSMSGKLTIMNSEQFSVKKISFMTPKLIRASCSK
jgi:hypothetical protein